jgi:hypothetical protein
MEQEDLEHLQSLMKSHLSNLSTFNDDTLDGLYDVITGEDWNLASELVTLLSNGEKGAPVHEHLMFRPLMSGACGVGDSRMILRPLHEYAQLPQIENYASGDKGATKQAAALVIVTERLYSLYNEARYTGDDAEWLPLTHIRGGVLLSGEALIQLTLDRPLDAERIAEIMIARSTTDTGLILSVLTADAPAVSDGII